MMTLESTKKIHQHRSIRHLQQRRSIWHHYRSIRHLYQHRSIRHLYQHRSIRHLHRTIWYLHQYRTIRHLHHYLSITLLPHHMFLFKLNTRRIIQYIIIQLNNNMHLHQHVSTSHKNITIMDLLRKIDDNQKGLIYYSTRFY